MSLADKISEARGSKNDKALLGALTMAYEQISKAQRFVFSPETVAACHALTECKPSSLLEVQPMCRSPFRTVWLEWGGNVPGRNFKDPEIDYVYDVAIPERFGCLLECLDDTNRRFGASFFWNFPRGRAPTMSTNEQIIACPLGVIINWHDDWQPMDRLTVLQSKIDLDKDIKKTWHAAKYLGDETQREALLKLNRQVVSAVCPHMSKFVEEARKQNSFEVMERFMQASAQDITGEVKVLQAALCLLNSKNCIAVEPADLSKINARRRKDCKRPLLSYSTVKISLSRADQRVADRNGITEDEIRKHIVRGHFKLRKSGVYWWRPFLRGNPRIGQVVRTGYEVVA